jgi:hypothetical protein
MNLQHQIINTREIPETISILKQTLPSVLQSTCYNENNNPFYKEVLETEIGHLFEHILIEYLCLLKLSQGYNSVEYCGVTKWNWRVYPKGSFHITVNAGIKDTEIFAEAMSKSITLINNIFASVSTPDISTPDVKQYIDSSALSKISLQSSISQ